MSTTQVDVLAIGAHPDDADLGVGGTLLVLAEAGLRTAILDLTRGELASRGTVEERMQEAQNAGTQLNVIARENAGLPDGGIQNTQEQRLVVAEYIRKFRPRLLIAPMAPDRHPDHTAAHDLVRDANFFAGVGKLSTEAYRAPQVLYYFPYHAIHNSPTFIVDVSAQYAQKKKALECYASQFYNPEYKGAETLVASKSFWEFIDHRAAYWGHQISAAQGEPLFAENPLPFNLAAFVTQLK